MSAAPDGPIAIYYEHPDWFKPLFAELDRREIPYERIDASAHSYDPAETECPYSLVFNRASPSAYMRGHEQVTFHTLSWLRHLERIRVPLVNGPTAYQMEISKALQLEVLEQLGLPYPRARVINNAALTLLTEANGVTDNPLVFPETNESLSGGNFHGRQRGNDRSWRGSRGARSGARAAARRAHHSRRGAGWKFPLRNQRLPRGKLVQPVPGRCLPDHRRPGALT